MFLHQLVRRAMDDLLYFPRLWGFLKIPAEHVEVQNDAEQQAWQSIPVPDHEHQFIPEHGPMLELAGAIAGKHKLTEREQEAFLELVTSFLGNKKYLIQMHPFINDRLNQALITFFSILIGN